MRVTQLYATTSPTGFVNSSDKQYNCGLFMQTFFSFAGTGTAPNLGILNIQPIFGYQLGNGRALSLGNSALVVAAAGPERPPGDVVLGPEVAAELETAHDLEGDRGNSTWVTRAASCCCCQGEVP